MRDQRRLEERKAKEEKCMVSHHRNIVIYCYLSFTICMFTTAVQHMYDFAACLVSWQILSILLHHYEA